MNQLRGAKVSLSTTSGEKLSGTILGVEKKQKPVGDKGQVIKEFDPHAGSIIAVPAFSGG